MLNILKRLKDKNKDLFGDTIWEYDSEADKKSTALSWFFKLPKNSKILEAGCGAGNYVFSLYKMGHKPIGIEIDEKRVKIAKEYMKKHRLNPRIINYGDLTKLPFKDEQFDAIFCHGVIEHIKDSELAVKEMSRVLKKGGHVMISVPNRYTWFTLSKLLLMLIDRIFKTRLWVCGYEKSFSQWKFKRLVKKYFEIEEFKKLEYQPGTTFPLYGKIMKILDKPFWILGFGGAWLHAWCKK
ncbi:MAG: class I SAM-dependent methyltransferase [Candidatus Pacearchaeota archaeon]|jgi:ubiquinone/menaquinone biosynthesis C-methylase UbiE